MRKQRGKIAWTSDDRATNLDSLGASTLSHQVRLEDHVYQRIKANKHDDESFSEAIERLIGGRSLRDLRDVFDGEQVTEMREAIERDEPVLTADHHFGTIPESFSKRTDRSGLKDVPDDRRTHN